MLIDSASYSNIFYFSAKYNLKSSKVSLNKAILNYNIMKSKINVNNSFILKIWFVYNYLYSVTVYVL